LVPQQYRFPIVLQSASPALESAGAGPRLPPRKPQYPLPDPCDTNSLALALGADGLGVAPFISSIDELSAGFCNWVYCVSCVLPSYGVAADGNSGTEVKYVAKVFSPMAKVRVAPRYRGAVDIAACAGDNAVGPELVYNDENCIVSVLVPGAELGESDVHGVGKFGDGETLCGSVGRRVAELHSLELGIEMPHMLWSTMGAMLDFIDAKVAGDLKKQVIDGWSVATLRDTIQTLQATIDALGCEIVTGHGDLKPTNVMVTPPEVCEVHASRSSRALPVSATECSDVVLIDFELSGPNYRGFDLCKFFRTNNSQRKTKDNQRRFMRGYCEYSKEVGSKKATNERLLVAEANLFLPLTWLEAGIFFMFAALSDPGQKTRWIDLAENRMKNFISTMEEFDDRVKEYKSSKDGVTNKL
jgi:thiamine kinase-like enzyme